MLQTNNQGGASINFVDSPLPIKKEEETPAVPKPSLRSRWYALTKIRIGRRVNRLDKIFLTRHFLTMFDAGLSWLEAIQVAIDESNNIFLKRSLKDIQKRMKNGQSLSECLSAYPQIFNHYFVAMVRVGERTGRLSESLKYLLDHQEYEFKLLTKVRNALLYPAAIMVVMILIVAGLVAYVIPRIVTIYNAEDIVLPPVTRVLINVSDFIVNYSWYLGAAVIIFALVLRKFYQTKLGRSLFGSILLFIPLLGKIVKQTHLIRFTRSLSDLIKSGISMEIALRTVANIMNISSYRNSLIACAKSVQQGTQLTDTLKRYPRLYPPLVVHMGVAGERSGKLDTMFDRLAEHYEDLVTNTTSNLATLIEPFLLILTGVIVGGIAIAVLWPIWNFAQIF